MPTYFYAPSVISILGPSGFQYANGPASDIESCNGNNNCNNNCNNNSSNNTCNNRSTTKFFESLVNKLEEMTLSLKEQFIEIEGRCNIVPKRGCVLAEAAIESTIVEVKYVYVQYIRRYGPPPNGIFDEELLTELRNQNDCDSSISSGEH